MEKSGRFHAPAENPQKKEFRVESSCNVMAHGDARAGKWRGNWRMEWVARTIHITSEHSACSITIADANISAASSTLNWRPRRFKGTRPFHRKTKSGFCACTITFQLASAHLKRGWMSPRTCTDALENRRRLAPLLEIRRPTHSQVALCIRVLVKQLRYILRVGRNSVVGIATRCGLGYPGIESRWRGARFSALLPTGPPSLLYNGNRVFPGGKKAGGWRWPSIPSNVEVKERVGLCLGSPVGLRDLL